MIVVDLLMRNCWTVHVCTSSWPRSTEWNAGPVLLGAAALEGVGKYLGPETNVGSLHGLALPFLRPPVRRFLTIFNPSSQSSLGSMALVHMELD